MRSTARRILASSIVFSTIAFGAAGQPRPAAVGDQPSFLDQSWSEDDRSWFYTITQGSQLMPYYWFLALERSGSNKLFLDDQLARFGYLPPYQTQRHSTRNPDRLPIGFCAGRRARARPLDWNDLRRVSHQPGALSVTRRSRREGTAADRWRPIGSQLFRLHPGTLPGAPRNSFVAGKVRAVRRRRGAHHAKAHAGPRRRCPGRSATFSHRDGRQ